MNLRVKVDRIIAGVLIGLMATMVVNVLWQVFSRYVIGTPSSFTDELARYLMIWLGILGAAYVSGKELHIAIDIVQTVVSNRTSAVLKNIIRIVIMAFSLSVLVIGGSRLVYLTYILEQYSPALQIPLALVYLVIPLSGLLILFYKTNDLINRK